MAAAFTVFSDVDLTSRILSFVINRSQEDPFSSVSRCFAEASERCSPGFFVTGRERNLGDAGTTAIGRVGALTLLQTSVNGPQLQSLVGLPAFSGLTSVHIALSFALSPQTPARTIPLPSAFCFSRSLQTLALNDVSSLEWPLTPNLLPSVRLLSLTNSSVVAASPLEMLCTMPRLEALFLGGASFSSSSIDTGRPTPTLFPERLALVEATFWDAHKADIEALRELQRVLRPRGARFIDILVPGDAELLLDFTKVFGPSLPPPGCQTLLALATSCQQKSGRSGRAPMANPLHFCATASLHKSGDKAPHWLGGVLRAVQKAHDRASAASAASQAGSGGGAGADVSAGAVSVVLAAATAATQAMNRDADEAESLLPSMDIEEAKEKTVGMVAGAGGAEKSSADASHLGHLRSLLRLIQKAGGNCFLLLDRKDAAGCTPLLRAAEAGDADAVALLLGRTSVDDPAPLFSFSASLATRNQRLESPLYLAALKGHSTCLEVILDHLMMLSTSTDEPGTSLAELLLKGGSEMAGPDGLSILQAAITSTNQRAIKVVLARLAGFSFHETRELLLKDEEDGSVLPPSLQAIVARCEALREAAATDASAERSYSHLLAFLSVSDRYSCNALWHAARGGQVSTTEALLQLRVPLANSQGENPTTMVRGFLSGTKAATARARAPLAEYERVLACLEARAVASGKGGGSKKKSGTKKTEAALTGMSTDDSKL